MGERSLLHGDRAWFVDIRTPARRMAVSTHADVGIVVISFWQGESCTGTFQLPLSEAPNLVDVLTAGMTSVADASPPLRIVE